MNQIIFHKKIDHFFEAGITVASITLANELINHNTDAKRYFFSKADESWLKWFVDNNLFVELRKKAEDPTKYNYRLAELEYLTRMSDKQPETVTEIILSVPISRENFNPEVIDRFFWITSLLPVQQIKSILPKILLEEWLPLMSAFGRSGYEYQKMVEKISQAKDYETAIILARIILTIRPISEFNKSERFSISDNFFYLRDISETGIFELLTATDNPQKKNSLKLLTEILSQIVDLGEDKVKSDVFEKTEPFYLLDVDIFKLGLDTSKRSHFREDIQNLVASCKVLIQMILVGAHENALNAKQIYSTYIAELPDSLTFFRLKLYAMTLFPHLFKNEIKEALFRIFNAKGRYFEIENGAEYHNALILGFGILEPEVQKEYIKNVIEYFSAPLEDSDKEKWRKRDGRNILSHIKECLSNTERTAVEKIFGKLLNDEKNTPHPSVGKVTSGIINNMTPFDPSSLSIIELIDRLKKDATPKALEERYKSDDFLNPRGAEGLADAIKIDFKKRRSEYFGKLNHFFDRDTIDAGYVYAILQQIDSMFRNKEVFSEDECIILINFFDLIKKSGRSKEFKPREEKSHLADWITVLKTATDILLEILALMKDSQVFKDNREKILDIIEYLLSIKSSPDIDDDERESNEPAFVAVNSVRGQAYRTFVQFTYNEGSKELSKEAKTIFERIVDNEKSNAVRFTLGQFLASFYYRDIDFVRSLLPKIFPQKPESKGQYFATWEGYLSTSLYKELFVELKDHYVNAIKINSEEYPKRKYLKGLDESLATHLALAYAHFDEFKIGDPLFNLFWETPNETRHYEFVSFIGRHCMNRDQAGDQWLKENSVKKEKIIDFWNWIIKTDIPLEPKTFAGFGLWINPNIEIIEDKIVIRNLPMTLKKSRGDFDWEYGLTKRITKFAELDPKVTLKVIHEYLIVESELNPHRRAPLFSLEHEMKKALEIIYKEALLKKDVEDLIALLIEKGSNSFWDLKDILK